MNLKKMKCIRKIAAVCCVLLLLWGLWGNVKAEEDTEISESMVLDEGIAWNIFTDSSVESVSPLTNHVSGHFFMQKERKYDII